MIGGPVEGHRSLVPPGRASFTRVATPQTRVGRPLRPRGVVGLFLHREEARPPLDRVGLPLSMCRSRRRPAGWRCATDATAQIPCPPRCAVTSKVNAWPTQPLDRGNAPSLIVDNSGPEPRMIGAYEVSVVRDD